ncbi:hypothetical protein [Falsirhodobacter sp. 20TX0035]|uniref:hypothetical protein n=1 Tax=Falsirhodobacter sp. 20TX0035 TaxID=3022019 RepID=UPI00232EF1BC|nr:hypothetical protein [Falsirhodobacter sp. 20TX0035]MDB6452515.1 hypothetical protein [Falsirhodobacter sp. 20TX0035]
MEHETRQRRPRRIDPLTAAARSRAEQPRIASLIHRELHNDIVAFRRKDSDGHAMKTLVRVG